MANLRFIPTLFVTLTILLLVLYIYDYDMVEYKDSQKEGIVQNSSPEEQHDANKKEIPFHLLKPNPPEPEAPEEERLPGLRNI